MRELLKILTCGSVDDGKSTLIGRLMFDAGNLTDDQKLTLKRESEIFSDGNLDYSLLLDGLEAEREQHITIDVAYRFFSTKNRSFIIADAPGHNEYTRNMAVGASFADVAVILIDAAKGVLPQTRRHYEICRLMGMTDFAFAVNKMDTVGYSEKCFRTIEREISEMISGADGIEVYIVPVSATAGDNVTQKSANMQWFKDETLLSFLEKTEAGRRHESGFVMPVQRVSAVSGAVRGYQGCVECGSISAGDKVTVFPSGESSTVSTLLVSGDKKMTAHTGNQITISVSDDMDISRGCVICRDFTPSVSTRFAVRMLWLDDQNLSNGKSYYLKLASSRVSVTVNLNDNETSASKNDFVDCTLTSAAPVVVDRFEDHRSLGSFILIDRVTHATSACGVIVRPLDNNYIHPVTSEITPSDRAEMKGQIPVTLWLTGLPASGKTTLANEVEKRLHAMGRHTMLLDGDDMRSGISAGLGFSNEGRAENIRLTAHVAKLMNDAGLIVLVALVSPREKDRKVASDIIGAAFKEIFVSAPVETCETRDVKGYYEKARNGLISGFTGISDVYEIPSSPDLIIDTTNNGVDEAADNVIAFLRENGLI